MAQDGHTTGHDKTRQPRIQDKDRTERARGPQPGEPPPAPEPFPGAEDVDEEELIGNAPEDHEGLTGLPPMPSGSGV